MYGLGIRLGYYLQWYGGVIASIPGLYARDEVPGARLALALFIAATFLALIIQTARNNLQVAEIYIILLLTFGAYIFLVPLFLWRLVTGCNPLLDPSRYPLVDPGPTHSDLHTPLLLAVSGFSLWFWFSRVRTLDNVSCREYGFLFTKIRLNNRAFQIVNIVLYFLLAVVVLVFFALRVVNLATDAENRNDREQVREWTRQQQRKYGRRWLAGRIRRLQIVDFVNKIVTATIIVVATELSIKWNHIGDINDLGNAGQLIPFLIGLGIIIRILYVSWKSRRHGASPLHEDYYHKKRPRPSHSPSSPSSDGPIGSRDEIDPTPTWQMPELRSNSHKRRRRSIRVPIQEHQASSTNPRPPPPPVQPVSAAQIPTPYVDTVPLEPADEITEIRPRSTG